MVVMSAGGRVLPLVLSVVGVLCLGADCGPGGFESLRGGPAPEPPAELPSCCWEEVSVGTYHDCVRSAAGEIQCVQRGGAALEPPDEGPWEAVGAGLEVCGLRVDGMLRCWGLVGGRGVYQGPAEAFSVEEGMGCALDGGGELHCWGGNGAALSSPPPPSDDYRGVAVDGVHGCLLHGNGVECWGLYEGDFFEPELLKNAPGGKFVEISVGSGTGCARTADGRVECWGAETLREGRPSEVKFEHLDLGWGLACGIEYGRGVWCWGGLFDSASLILEGDYANLSVGGERACVIDIEGELVCWEPE